MLGIENLKKMVKFGLDLTKQIAVSGKDGWQWTDSFSFIDEFSQIGIVVKSWEDVKKELAELSYDEKEELNDYIAGEFDLENDRTEALIEHSLQLAVSVVSLVEEFRKPPAPEA